MLKIEVYLDEDLRLYTIKGRIFDDGGEEEELGADDVILECLSDRDLNATSIGEIKRLIEADL